MRLLSLMTLMSLLPLDPANEVLRDCQYGSTSQQTADLYMLPRQEGPHPCVILIHGGGWMGGTKDVYAGLAKQFNRAGFSVVAINYTLAQEGKLETWWPAQIIDVQNAMKWLRDNHDIFGIDPNRIGVLGHSAGAHLALMLRR